MRLLRVGVWGIGLAIIFDASLVWTRVCSREAECACTTFLQLAVGLPLFESFRYVQFLFGLTGLVAFQVRFKPVVTSTATASDEDPRAPSGLA